MSFNSAEYSEALDVLVQRLEELYAGSPETYAALSEMCRILRISRIDAFLCGAPKDTPKKDIRVCVFGGDAPDSGTPFVFEDTADDGSVVTYKMYPYQDAPAWSDTELRKINTVARMLFVFNGRARILQIADELMFHDSQLGIFSLNYFNKMIEKYVADGQIGKYAACSFNLNHFSIVNKTYGREAGTDVMRRYVCGLQKTLDADEFVCRVGGDAFLVLVRKEHLETVKLYFEGALIAVDDKDSCVTVSARAGCFMIPDECASSLDILENANAALNIAGNEANPLFVLYDDKVKKSVEEVRLVESLFQEGIEKGEFLVYYQPKVTLKDYRLAGAEALCRWNHGGSIVQPSDFIPILEQSRFICTLDFYVLEQVCRDIRNWIDNGLPIVKVSVNLSRVHLGDGALLDRIMEVIDRYRVPHEYIEIELTETTTDVDFNELRHIVTGLRGTGVSTSVDDFGIGYSSLNLIRELPWNVLKIDKSFLPEGNGDNDKQKEVMLRHVISMAQSLGLECIVEGVETINQIMLLKESNCYRAQGFYFDMPLPEEVFRQRLLELSTLPA